MIKELYRSYVLPASILSGTIIGAGVFALPYIFVQSGWLLGLFYLVSLTAVIMLIHSMFAQVILHTEGKHRFVGYVRRYLGEYAFYLSLATSLFGLILTLTAYLILGASFLNFLYSGGTELQKVVAFWIIGSILVLVRVRLLALLEFLVVVGILLIIAIIFVMGAGNVEKLFAAKLFDTAYLFLPFGPILFALVGRTAISSVVQYIKEARLPASLVGKSIVIGTAIPAVFYLLFVVGIIGLSDTVSADSISGLANTSIFVLWIVGVLGLLSLLSTYIVLGIEIAENMNFDLRLPRATSVFLVIALPIAFYLFGLKNFLDLVSIVGGVFVSLESAMVALMWQRIVPRKSRVKVLVWALFAIFLSGAFYEIMNAIR